MSYLNRERRTAGPLVQRKHRKGATAPQPRVSYDCRTGEHSKCAMRTCTCQRCDCRFKSA